MSAQNLPHSQRYPPPPSPPTSRFPDHAQSPPPPTDSTQPTPRHHGIMSETSDELTEDERIEYEKGVLTWSKTKDWRFWIRKEWIWYYVALVLIIIVVALMAFFHRQIVNWLTPFVQRMETLRVGWLIPVAILFVLSFPPLFGNEIVLVLIGLVWGLGVGFAIAAVGTILGEVANFFVFKYWCSARAHRMTKKSLNYACLSQAMVEGGFPMAFVVRLSAVPTHFTTVVFAVCGMKFWHFGLALILGLPKQLLAVYVGVVLGEDNNGTTSTNSHLVSDLVWAATVVISLLALWYIYRGMLRVRKKVLIGMRTDLQSKHVATSSLPTSEEFVAADADERRDWKHPFTEQAVTAPRSAAV